MNTEKWAVRINGKVYPNVLSFTEETKNGRKDKDFQNRLIIEYVKDGKVERETIYEPYTFSYICSSEE